MASECSFEGNADLYGLGIRIELYIQLVTTVFVAGFLPTSNYSAFFKNTYASLLGSTWVIILKESASRDIRGVEVALFSWLSLFQLGGLLMLMSSPQFIDSMAAFLVWTIIPTLMQVMATSYWLWYFFRGLDVLPKSDCMDEYMFFFTKVSLYHWFRTLSKVTAIFGFVVSVYGKL